MTAIGPNTPANTAATSSAAKSTSPFGNVNPQELFLKLLVAQLKTQDPMAPMDSQSMIQQMTQMTSVEQLLSISKGMEALAAGAQTQQAVSMLGHTVRYNTTDDATATGKVSSISLNSGKATLVLESGSRVALDQVVEVLP